MEKEKDRDKEKVGDRPAKLNEKKSDRELKNVSFAFYPRVNARVKSKGDIFLLEEQNENFVAAVRK